MILQVIFMASVTQSCLAGLFLCSLGASIMRYFLQTPITHKNLWELTFQVRAHTHTHTHACHTKELFPNHLCNHFGPRSEIVARYFQVWGVEVYKRWLPKLATEFGEGDAKKQKSVKRSVV